MGFAGGGSVVKNPPAMQEPQETGICSLNRENPLEEEMATHSKSLAWRIPWTEEPGGLQSIGLQRVRHDSVTQPTCRHTGFMPRVGLLGYREKSILTPCWKCFFDLLSTAFVTVIKHNCLSQRILPLCLTVKLKCFCSEQYPPVDCRKEETTTTTTTTPAAWGLPF